MNCCIEHARDGDPTAREALVDELRPRIASMAGHYARCTGEDPDDLLQEAWVGLLEALPELNTCIGSPEQYLIRHARWRLLDAVKRARIRRCLPLEETSPQRLLLFLSVFQLFDSFFSTLLIYSYIFLLLIIFIFLVPPILHQLRH